MRSTQRAPTANDTNAAAPSGALYSRRSWGKFDSLQNAILRVVVYNALGCSTTKVNQLLKNFINLLTTTRTAAS